MNIKLGLLVASLTALLLVGCGSSADSDVSKAPENVETKSAADVSGGRTKGSDEDAGVRGQ